MRIAQQVFRTGRASTVSFTSIVAAVAAGFALLNLASRAAADPPYVPQGPFPSVVIGDTVPPPTDVFGKEYSTHTPGVFGSGDEDHFHAKVPEQVLNWDGVGGTYNGSNFYGSRFTSDPPDTIPREVDALANKTDALFHEVIGDVSHLIFSVDDDGAVYYEKRVTGAGGVWAPPPAVDAPHPPEDLDALEVWGPEPPPLSPPDPAFVGDGNRYSLEDFGPLGIPDPLGVSVWDVSGGLPATPLWLTGEIAASIAIATGGVVQVPIDLINLDGMMTFSTTEDDPLGGPGIPVDELLFTVDPIAPAAGPGLDGGEIFVAKRTGGIGGPITAGFLFHGGHFWDTAFPVAATFGLRSENVNALESITGVPEPASAVLAVLAMVGLVGLRRRR